MTTNTNNYLQALTDGPFSMVMDFLGAEIPQTVNKSWHDQANEGFSHSVEILLKQPAYQNLTSLVQTPSSVVMDFAGGDFPHTTNHTSLLRAQVKTSSIKETVASIVENELPFRFTSESYKRVYDKLRLQMSDDQYRQIRRAFPGAFSLIHLKEMNEVVQKDQDQALLTLWKRISPPGIGAMNAQEVRTWMTRHENQAYLQTITTLTLTHHNLKVIPPRN